MRLNSFGAIIFPQASATHQLPTSFRSSVVQLRNGGFDQDGANAYAESKIVTATFWVSVNTIDTTITSIDDFIDSLVAEAAQGRQLLRAKMRNGDLREVNAKMLQFTTQPSSKVYVPDVIRQDTGYEQVTVSFEVVYPYWKATNDTQLFSDSRLFSDSGLFSDSAQKETATINSTQTDFSIDNTGTVAHEDTILTVTANAGATITDVRVDNLTTGEYVDWSGTLTAGEVLTINTLPQTIDKDGTGEYDNTTLPNDQLGFYTLALGENNFRITLTSISGGDATAEFFWQRQYIR